MYLEKVGHLKKKKFTLNDPIIQILGTGPEDISEMSAFT